MSLDPIQEEYNPGNTITCAAKGNPTPSLRWVDQANNTIVDSGTLLIEPAMEGRQTYSCLAQNEVRGSTISAMATITFNVTSKFLLMYILIYFKYCSSLREGLGKKISVQHKNGIDDVFIMSEIQLHNNRIGNICG